MPPNEPPAEEPPEPESEYRPLVAKGEDREKVLAEVIERWVTETPEWIDKIDSPQFYNNIQESREPGTLYGIDLRDDNEHADPIDLGFDLLEPFSKRLLANQSEAATKPLATAALVKCRVHSTNADSLHLPCHLVLSNCDVIGLTSLRFATIRGTTIFKHSYFREDIDCEQAAFMQAALFDNTTFAREAFFEGVVFRSDLWFDCGSINEYAIFKAQRYGFVSFYWTDLRRARVADSDAFTLSLSPTERRLRSWTDRINWRRIRSLGELSVCTRVSYIALAGIPVMAGLWGPLRRGIAWLNGELSRSSDKLDEVLKLLEENPGTASATLEKSLQELAELLDGTLPAQMPLGWLLAFLAAFCIVVAQLIYETHSPELIRKTSEDDLVERANEHNRTDGEITDERLREALGYLENAAELLPHRHCQWFVRRQNRTVWIPNSLDYFHSAKIDQVRPTGCSPADWTPKKIADPDPEVRPEDRKRIAIEEGQKARYDIAAFESREAAWISGGLYLLAIWLLLMITIRQLAHVADASAMGFLSWLGYSASGSSLVAIGSGLIVGMTLLGTVTVAKLPRSHKAKSRRFAEDGE